MIGPGLLLATDNALAALYSAEQMVLASISLNVAVAFMVMRLMCVSASTVASYF